MFLCNLPSLLSHIFYPPTRTSCFLVGLPSFYMHKILSDANISPLPHSMISKAVALFYVKICLSVFIPSLPSLHSAAFLPHNRLPLQLAFLLLQIIANSTMHNILLHPSRVLLFSINLVVSFFHPHCFVLALKSRHSIH